MRLSLNLNPQKIAILLGMVAVIFALQSLFSEYVLTHFIGMDANTAPARLLDIFSVNLEESLPTWFSIINLFLASLLLAWVAVTKQAEQGLHRGYWLGLSIIFLYLSMDEGASIHESTSGPLQQAFDSTGFFEFGWLILGIPLVILFGIVYFRFWWRLPSPTRTLFAIAGILYVGGAVVIEGISANQYALDGGSSFFYLLIATVEELCEMLGVIVFIYALLDYLKRRDNALALQMQSTLSDFTPFELRWRYSLRTTALAFGAFLLFLNGGLLVWGIASGDDSGTSVASYHFFIMVDELGAEGVNITHISGVFSLSDETSRRTVTALAVAYPEVQVLSLPNLNASVVISSDEPVLTNDSIIELMAWIEERDYIFYDTPIVRAMLGLP